MRELALTGERAGDEKVSTDKAELALDGKTNGSAMQ
jgi:hypothetical protein